MWTFDEAFVLLAARLPGWLPWPRLWRARAARRRMLAYTRAFNEAMDFYLDDRGPGPRWQHLADVSSDVRARLETFRSHGLSLDARAGCDLGLS